MCNTKRPLIALQNISEDVTSDRRQVTSYCRWRLGTGHLSRSFSLRLLTSDSRLSLSLMNKSRLQVNLEYLIARLLLAVFGALPPRVAIGVGATLARAGYSCSCRLRA